MKRFFNPLAVTGYLDVSDVTDLYQKEKRDILRITVRGDIKDSGLGK